MAAGQYPDDHEHVREGLIGRCRQRRSADRSAREGLYRPHSQAGSCWRGHGPRWEIARSGAREPAPQSTLIRLRHAKSE